MKYEKVLLGLLSPIFLIIGVIIGSYLSHKNAQDLFKQQRVVELRERSYANLISLRVPLIQVQQTLYEAKLLTIFYDFRYKYISHDSIDLEAAKEENKRMLSLIPEVINLQREFATTLADIRLGYELSIELEDAIEDLRKFRTITFQEPDPDIINSPDKLNNWKEKGGKQIQSLLTEEWSDPIQQILPILFNQIKMY